MFDDPVERLMSPGTARFVSFPAGLGGEKVDALVLDCSLRMKE